MDILWPRQRHTAAKHQILTGYLDAWIPILAQAGHDDLVLIDGFAGPGSYSEGEPGSPLLMLDAFLRRKDRARLRARLHYFFIEEHEGRFRHLCGELAKKSLPPELVTVTPIHASFERAFPDVVTGLRRRFGKLPPTFAFIDPFGADQAKPELHARLLKLPRCEVLIYVPLHYLARFVTADDMERTLTNLYGGREWEEARQHPDIASRKRILHDLFRDQMRRSCEWVRSFEIVPESGVNSYSLFFGTNNRQGLRKMKAAMWKIDPVGGQRFRDSTVVDHPVLFEPRPNFGPLLTMLKNRFGTDWFTIEEAQEFTLTDTPFRDDAHLKTPTLAPAERKTRELEVKRPGASTHGFKPGTRMRFRESVHSSAQDGE